LSKNELHPARNYREPNHLWEGESVEVGAAGLRREGRKAPDLVQRAELLKERKVETSKPFLRRRERLLEGNWSLVTWNKSNSRRGKVPEEGQTTLSWRKCASAKGARKETTKRSRKTKTIM